MKNSPFVYGNTIIDEAFAYREKEVLKLKSNVSKNKTILIQKDLIHEVEGTYELLDPAFELWFREQFLNQPYVLI